MQFMGKYIRNMYLKKNSKFYLKILQKMCAHVVCRMYFSFLINVLIMFYEFFFLFLG